MMVDRNTSEVGAIQLSVNIQTYVSPMKLMLYTVTTDQMDTYAELGLLVNIFLALFGVASGAAIGLWIAVKQGGLSPVNNATLITAMWASAIFALVTLGLTIFFCYRQRKCKREWFTAQQEV